MFDVVKVRALQPGVKLDRNGKVQILGQDIIDSIRQGWAETGSFFQPPITCLHQDGDNRDRKVGEDAEGEVQNLEFESDGGVVFTLGRLQKSFWDGMTGESGDGLARYFSPQILPPGHPYNPSKKHWNIGHLARVPRPADPTLNQKPIDLSAQPIELSADTTPTPALVPPIPMEDDESDTDADNKTPAPAPTPSPEPTASATPPATPAPDAAPEKTPEATSDRAPDLATVKSELAKLKAAISDLPTALAAAISNAAPQPTTTAPAATELSARVDAELVALRTERFKTKVEALATQGCIPVGEVDAHVKKLMEFSQAEQLMEFSASPVDTYLDNLGKQSRGTALGQPETSNGAVTTEPDAAAEYTKKAESAWQTF